MIDVALPTTLRLMRGFSFLFPMLVLKLLMLFRFLFALLMLVLEPNSLLPLYAQQNASIVVKAGEVLGPVNRLVFGQNLEAADNAHMLSSDTTDPNLIQTGDGFWDPGKGAPVPQIVSQSQRRGHEHVALSRRMLGAQL